VLSAYLERLGVELHGDAYIFRNRSGAAYSSDTLGDDFRDVRAAEFGALERRTIGHDFRRTGAVEAITGGAQAEHLAHAMGNTLSASNALFATYVPVNVGDVARGNGSSPPRTAKTPLKDLSTSPSVDDPQQMARQHYLFLRFAHISQVHSSVRVRVFV
jgi:hypothetical protein